MKKLLLPLCILVFAVACRKSAADLPAPVQQTVKPVSLSQAPSAINARLSSTGRIPDGYTISGCVTPMEVPLIAGQNINVGTVTVWNDAVNVYVAYQLDGDYKLTQTHLFAGTCGTMPVNNSGNPQIGRFPFKQTHGAGVSLYVYTIPRSSLPIGCLCIAAHAAIVAYNSTGTIVFSQTGWGQGSQVTGGGSWAMQFGYCIQDCTDDGSIR